MLNTNTNVLPKNKRTQEEIWSFGQEKRSNQIITVKPAEQESALVPLTGLVLFKK